MSPSFWSWLTCYLSRQEEEWVDFLAEIFRRKYATPVHPDWVKEGLIESYKVVSESFKSLVLAIGSGLVSWVVAQVPAQTRIIPLRWNLLIIAFAGILVGILHLRKNYKVSTLNARMDALCGVRGEIFPPVPCVSSPYPSRFCPHCRSPLIWLSQNQWYCPYHGII